MCVYVNVGVSGFTACALALVGVRWRNGVAHGQKGKDTDGQWHVDVVLKMLGAPMWGKELVPTLSHLPLIHSFRCSLSSFPTPEPCVLWQLPHWI